MRSLALLIVALGLSAEAPPPEVQRFEQALSQSRFDDAAAAIDKLIEARTPVDGKPRPDPLLNSMLGRLYLAERFVAPAATYLDRAPIAVLPPGLGVSTALARGHAHEVLGDRTAALAAYRDAAAASTSESDRRRAALGISHQLRPDDPAAARAEVVHIAEGPSAPERWEARYVLALASSVLGDRRVAEAYADQAWSDAATAGLTDLAPLRVAVLRAGLAAARHDLQVERAMLMAADGVKVSGSPALAAQLPVCGDDGVQPSDYVIFGFVVGPYATRQLFPIAASRPGAIPPFQRALERVVPISGANDERPKGTVFTVACRTVVSSDYIAAPLSEDPLLDWMVERGIYPASASNEADDKHINAVADRIDALTAKFGKDSWLLVGSRWQMAALLERRGRSGDPILPGQLTDLGTQVAEGLRRGGAPEWIAQSIEARPKYERIVAAAINDPSQIAVAEALSRDQLLRTPFPYARRFLIGMLTKVSGDLPSAAAQLIVNLNDHAPSVWNRRDREAWLLTIARARHSLGEDAEARSALASAGFGPNLCALSDTEPKLLEQHFSYSDYPDDLIAGEQEGAVAFEFDLTTAGSMVRPRAVYSLPSGVFDDVTARGLAGIRYTPPRISGKPSACRGIVQTIQWRIQDGDDFSRPTFSPTPPAPTT